VALKGQLVTGKKTNQVSFSAYWPSANPRIIKFTENFALKMWEGLLISLLRILTVVLFIVFQLRPAAIPWIGAIGTIQWQTETYKSEKTENGLTSAPFESRGDGERSSK
jgi:hypothetical protein